MEWVLRLKDAKIKIGGKKIAGNVTIFEKCFPILPPNTKTKYRIKLTRTTNILEQPPFKLNLLKGVYHIYLLENGEYWIIKDTILVK